MTIRDTGSLITWIVHTTPHGTKRFWLQEKKKGRKKGKNEKKTKQTHLMETICHITNTKADYKF